MIDTFYDWIITNADSFKEKKLQYEVTESPRDIAKQSLRVDFDNEKYLSRITVWGTGECKLEVIEIETEETILDRYFRVESNDDLDRCFLEIFEKIRG